MKKTVLVMSFLTGGAQTLFLFAWIGRLFPVAGHTCRAESGLISLALLGMAVGSAWGVRNTISFRAGLNRLLVLLVIGLGLGLLMPFLAALIDAVYPGLGALSAGFAGRMLLCGMVLAPAAAVLSAQIPLLTLLCNQRAHGADQYARAYSACKPTAAVFSSLCLGAAGAIVVAGSGLLLDWDIRDPGHAAISIQIVLLVVTYALKRQAVTVGHDRDAAGAVSAGRDWDDAGGRAADPPAYGAPAVSALDEIRSSSLYAALFCQGFALATLVLLWPAILVFFNASRARAGTAVVAAALIGLALGAAFMGRFLRQRQPTLTMGAGLLLFSGAVFCSGPAILGQWIAASGFFSFVLSGLPLFPGALGLGAIVPLAAGFQTRGRDATMRIAGLIIGALLLGAALGALAATGFVLPNLSLKLGVMVSGFMILASGLLMLIFARTSAGAKGLLMGGNLILIWVVAWFMAHQGRLSHPLVFETLEFHHPLSASHLQLEEYREDPEGVVAVIRDLAAQEYRLYIDGRPCLSTGSRDAWRHLLGHLPVLFCAEPKRVLVAGYGIGHLAGSLTLHPEVERVEIVERNAACMHAAAHFSLVNRRAGVEDLGRDKPRFSLDTGDDPAVHLRLDQEGYDLIALDPAEPFDAYRLPTWTRSFYETCVERLHAGGVFCRAIPVDLPAPSDFELLLNTFVQSFPGSAYFLVDDHLLMMGFCSDDWRLSWPGMNESFSHPGLQGELAQMGFACPEAVAGVYVGDGKALSAVLDNKALLEDAKSFPRRYSAMQIEKDGEWVGENLALLLKVEAGLADRVAWDEEQQDQDDRAALLERMKKFSLSARMLLRGRMVEAKYAGAAAGADAARDVADWKPFYEKAFYLNPDDRRAARGYARSLVEEVYSAMLQGRYVLAREIAAKAAAVAPELWEVYKAGGLLNLAAGNTVELEECVEVVQQMRPFSNLVLAFKAELARMQDDDEARSYFTKLLAASGGLSKKDRDLMAGAVEAQQAGEARYAVLGLNRLIELLVMGPDAVLETGRLAWNVARGANAELLDKAREELLFRLESNDDFFLPALRGLGFFQDEYVRKLLREKFETCSGARREAVLESLIRAGDTQMVVRVLEEDAWPEALRCQAARLAGELKIQEALAPLIGLLEDPVDSLRLSAFVALLSMTHVHFDYDPHAPLEARARAVERWQRWYEVRSGQEEP